MSKHTPGPWAAERSTGTGTAIFIHADGIKPSIAIANPELESCEANACLIAAAPELLEALEVLLGPNAGDAIFGIERFIPNPKWLARAAIAKARGRE